MTHALDAMAVRLFTTAIDNGQAGELLNCLFEGGSATVDGSGRLVMVNADILGQLGRER